MNSAALYSGGSLSDVSIGWTPQLPGALSGWGRQFEGPDHIFYNSSSRQIQVTGTGGNDRVVISQVGTNIVRVNFVGVQIGDFDISDIDSLQFHGHAGDDILNNQTGIATRAYGQQGNDRLIGGAGNDMLNGGTGNDFLSGGLGNDAFQGWIGNDEIYGGGGDDNVAAGQGNDLVFGGSGNDVLIGNDGNDALHGGIGNDRIYGGAGADTLYGQNGNDRIFGHDQMDTIIGGNGDDLISGGDQHDTIQGGAGSDILMGDDGNDTIRSSQGINQILGGAGNDKIYGGRNKDTINGGPGSDIIYAGEGHDVVRGSSGRDQIFSEGGNDLVFAGSGNDEVNGGSGADRLHGEHGNDLLFGKDGRDILYGGSGNDALIGGLHRDVLHGNGGQDHLLYFAADEIGETTAADLRIKLQNRTSRWTDEEIAVINRGLDYLHGATGNSRLVKDALTGNDLLFEKVNRLPGGAAAINSMTIMTRDNQTTYNRIIRFADWDETNQARNDQQALAVVHEIAHNWDSKIEMAAAPRVAESDWSGFLGISRWRKTNPNRSNYVRSADGHWWHLANAEFARSYGNINPFEDWATLWERYFDANAARPSANTNLGRKLTYLGDFFNKLK